MNCSDWPGLGQVPISWALEWVLPQTGLGSREQDRKSKRCYQQEGCVDPGQANPMDVQCQRVFPTYLWTGRGRLEDEARSSARCPPRNLASSERQRCGGWRRRGSGQVPSSLINTPWIDSAAGQEFVKLHKHYCDP